jgi:hypothetical protein
MFYIKINDAIRELLDRVRDSFKLGCKVFCRLQLIALDEMELLRKELELKGLKKFTNEEFKEILKNSDKVYFNSIHICEDSKSKDDNETPDSINDSIDDESIMTEIKKDKVRKVHNEKYFDSGTPEHIEDNSILNSLNNSDNKKIKTENSLSYAFSMVGSFFLIVLGSYYLGKHFFGMQDSSTYKLVLVITIIVLISEMFLLIIKLNKSDENNLLPGKLKERSFAYRFNKKYREKFASYDSKKTKATPKTKIE